RDVVLTGLAASSLQPDRRIVELLVAAGMMLEWRAGALHASGRPVRPLQADLDESPDLAPVLAVLAATVAGTSRLTGLARLRDKESDRLAAVAEGLSALGVTIETGAGELSI